MSKDIRSYFTSPKPALTKPSQATKSRKRIVISDSDDEETKVRSPVKRTCAEPIKRNKRPLILIDSDDESAVKEVSKKKNVRKVAAIKDAESPKKFISPTELFGKDPVRREEAVKVTKKLQKKEAKDNDGNDNDFETALLQLDTSELEDVNNSETIGYNTGKYGKKEEKKEKQKKNQSPKKNSHNPKKNSHSPEKNNHSPRKNTPEKKGNYRKNVSPKKTLRESTSSPKKISKRHADSASEDEPAPKKIAKKESPSKKTEIDPYEEGIQKKKQSTAMYQQYLQRGGARNPGSKKIPEGEEYCLAGLSFLITGVLDSLEREEAEELIKKYGGRILHQVSKKTDYVIVGDQPGPAKMAKAQSMNIKMISEDDLLDMIRTRPKGDPSNVPQLKQSRTKSKERSDESTDREADLKSPSLQSKEKSSEKILEKIKTVDQTAREMKHKNERKSLISELTEKSLNPKESLNPNPQEVNGVLKEKNIESVDATEALVEKYRPKTMKQIIGQQGDKSCAKKLYNWLSNWYKNQRGPVKPTKPSPWAKNDDGAFFKAALLSGPPGIGKTTTAQVVCKELGFDLIEFNASDTRSKKLLEEEVEGILSNSSMKKYYMGYNEKIKGSKHVLLMDEVDGMAGNEDRGGLQQLITLIKSTEIPIICICNDRNNPKMRTLANYTFDLRFAKPRLEQIRGAMKSICYKENIEISTEDLDRLIESTNYDVRQVINHLSLLSSKKLSSGQEMTSNRKHINKDLKLGPWDIVKKVFSAEEHKNMSIHDKSDLFFHDYSIVPLFIQENYLSVTPKAPKNEWLNRVARSAESLAIGDVVEKNIRTNSKWSLLPLQACYCSVIPGTLLSGFINRQINFPGWFGRNSKRTKFDRLAQEITIHMHLTTGASKDAVNLDYLKPLRNLIVRPLIVNGLDGVDTAVAIMNTYHLLREDLDSLIEISLWPGETNPLQRIDTKVLTAFTRTYNKKAMLPYVAGSGSNKVKKQAQTSEDFLVEEDDAADNLDEEEENDNVEADKMIKAKKPSSKRSESTAKKVESSNKKVNSTNKRSEKTSKRGGAANKKRK